LTGLKKLTAFMLAMRSIVAAIMMWAYLENLHGILLDTYFQMVSIAGKNLCCPPCLGINTVILLLAIKIYITI